MAIIGDAPRRLSKDVSDQLERIPPSYKMIRQVRPRFACTGRKRVIKAPTSARRGDYPPRFDLCGDAQLC